jgi:TolB-like protein
MGDGALVEFPSVVEAVECAVDIQRGMVEREAGRTEQEHIRFRIGINLGDVLIDGDDLYGDGVNIAARLQALAEPGGIVLSSAAFDQVTGKVAVAFRDLGERRLKHIARPVRLYALGGSDVGSVARPQRRLRWLVGSAAALAMVGTVAAGFLWGAWDVRTPVTNAVSVPVGDRPAIAVLPFTNLADPSDSYFSDGLTEDIAGALARFGELAVIDPAASFAVRDPDADIAVVGRELGARYFVRGTVRRDGTRLRVTAQLVDVPTGALRWSQRYDVAVADIFSVQDDITRQLAGAMAVRLDQLEQARIAAKPPDSLEVYDLVLHGRRLVSEGTRASNRQARQILAEAVAKDPGYAPAHAALGWALHEYAINGWTEFPADANAEAERAAHAALAVDPGLASASRLLGSIFLTRQQFELALAELDRAIDANPSDAKSYEYRGDALMSSGDHMAAIASLEAAQKLNPGIGYGVLGICYYLLGRYDDAVATLTRGLPSERAPQFRAAQIATLAAAYAQLGNAEGAAQARAELAKVAPFFDPALLLSQFRSEADRAHLSDGLGKAGIDS